MGQHHKYVRCEVFFFFLAGGGGCSICFFCFFFDPLRVDSYLFKDNGKRCSSHQSWVGVRQHGCGFRSVRMWPKVDCAWGSVTGISRSHPPCPPLPPWHGSEVGVKGEDVVSSQQMMGLGYSHSVKKKNKNNNKKNLAHKKKLHHHVQGWVQKCIYDGKEFA